METAVHTRRLNTGWCLLFSWFTLPSSGRAASVLLLLLLLSADPLPVLIRVNPPAVSRPCRLSVRAENTELIDTISFIISLTFLFTSVVDLKTEGLVGLSRGWKQITDVVVVVGSGVLTIFFLFLIKKKTVRL